ncbi:uncharacterized protein LOC122252584 [Penaeus japonicus]|uniref:uncharacterized protein LOC122252584 n=1 Tax=Penaeus japonicus TaxID=27405 RepID=UPI001C70F046|nr:uncharacterized protein LOC122252584 [Penaeus japonicus]
MMNGKTRRTARSSRGTSKNALRERSRVESLRRAYLELQAAIPSVPAHTKLSKLDVLVLATTYISHLSKLLQDDCTTAPPVANYDNNNNNNNNNYSTLRGLDALPANTLCSNNFTEASANTPALDCANVSRVQQKGLLHPVKKWPMRVRLYAGVGAGDTLAHVPDAAPPSHAHFQGKVDDFYPPVMAAHPRGMPPTPQGTHQGLLIPDGGQGRPTTAWDESGTVFPHHPLGAAHHHALYTDRKDSWGGGGGVTGVTFCDLAFGDVTSCHSPC